MAGTEDSLTRARNLTLTLRAAGVLRDLEVSGVVIGGQAVIQAGYVRNTEDADFAINGYRPEMEQILEAFQGTSVRPLFDDPIEIAMRGGVLPMVDTEHNFKIDFGFNPSPYLEMAIERAVPIQDGALEARSLHLNDILIQKAIAGRGQDQLDCVKLMQLRPDDVDHADVEHWLWQFERIFEQPLVERHRGWRREAEQIDAS